MTGLTKKQADVLTFIHDSIESAGFPPTLREIGEHVNIRSTNGVCEHIRALERKGFVVRSDMKSRGLRLTAKASASFQGATPVSEFDLIVIRNRETGLFAGATGLEWRSAPHCWSSLEAADHQIRRVQRAFSEIAAARAEAISLHVEWLRVAEVRLLRARLRPPLPSGLTTPASSAS